VPQATVILSVKRIVGKTVFHKGERVSVSEAFAIAHENDEFFKIEMQETPETTRLREAREEMVVDDDDDAPKRPDDPKRLIAAIRRAQTRLDPDKEGHFTRDGKPNANALSNILGYGITAVERDVALGFDEDDEDEGLDTGAEEAQPPPKQKLVLKEKGAAVEV